MIGHSQQAAETDRKLKEKELKALIARDEELDGLFERIYEDNVSGKLSDDRFAKMSRRYEDEQKELAGKIKKLRSEIEKQSSQAMTTDMFISLVRRYTRARKLTPRMLNKLVVKIEVYHAEKIDGVWEQRLLPRLLQIMCKPPKWCKIEAPQRRFYYGQKESHAGRKGPAGENPRTAADGEHRQHG